MVAPASAVFCRGLGALGFRDMGKIREQSQGWWFLSLSSPFVGISRQSNDGWGAGGCKDEAEIVLGYHYPLICSGDCTRKCGVGEVYLYHSIFVSLAGDKDGWYRVVQ